MADHQVDEEGMASPPPPPSSAPQCIKPTLKYITRFNANSKGEFKATLNSVPVVLMGDSGSARNLISSDRLALVLGEHYINHLEKKSVRPIFDCNSKALQILGAVQLDVQIEKFRMDAEFFCYKGNNQTVLLGFTSMHEHNLLVYPRLGLFQCSHDLNEEGDNCFMAEDGGQIAVETQEILLPVASTSSFTLQPGACANVPAQVLLPAASPNDKSLFMYGTFVFHSEKIQNLPLNCISCYFQYQSIQHDMKVILRYCNHTKEPMLVSSGQIIAHAQELPECPAQAIKSSNNEILKYIASIFKPDLVASTEEEDKASHKNEQKHRAQHNFLRVASRVPTRNHASNVPHRTPRNKASNGHDEKQRTQNNFLQVSARAPLRHSKPCAPPPAPDISHHTPRTRYEVAYHASNTAPVNRQKPPSLISSKPSTPYSYKTELHELKGPDEIQGGYKQSDIRIESNDPAERAFIYHMYDKYKDAVSQSEYDAGTFVGRRMTFTLKKGTQTFHAKAYPLSSALKPQADALINQLISAGIVGKMTAPAIHIAPIHFVVKNYPDLPPHLARYAGEKDTSQPRKLRAVINHRVLNASVDLPSRFPQATIPEILRKMHPATIASTTDLRAAFYSIQLHPDVFPLMAFEYASELYFFKRCPMGFVMSSFALAAATQYMKLRHGLTQCEFVADDCLIWGETASDYRTQVEKFFAALSATGFKLHPLKSTWWVRSNLPVLGFILNLECKSLLAAPQKVKALISTTQPRNKREIRRFVGAVSFLSQFIFGLQQLLRPLHTAASPKGPFVWSDACHAAWLAVKRSVASLPALRLPSPLYPLDLHTDGSPGVTRSLCWVWTQRQGGTENYLIQFGSRCLAAHHLALSQVELEALCLLSALQTDRHLVNYTSISAHTDSKGLTFVAAHEESQSKLRRWRLYLESLPLTLHFTRNTCGLIRLSDMIGRQRQEIVKAIKIKKPMGRDCVVFPTYDLSGLPPMPFQQCWALLKDIIQLQKLAGLEVGHPLLPDLSGVWRPLDNLVPPQPSPARHQQGSLKFLEAARCPPVPATADLPHASKEAALLAAQPNMPEMHGQEKVTAWQRQHRSAFHLLPASPSVPPATSYNLSLHDKAAHHLPSIPHQSEYSNPTLLFKPNPVLLQKYDIHNLQQEEKSPALRFLMIVAAELRGFPLLAVRQQQEDDEECSVVMNKLKKGVRVAGYGLFNGILLKVIRQPTLKLMLVLPQLLGRKFLAHLHESTSLFHLSGPVMTKIAKKHFFIKALSKIALQIAQDCHQCQLYNRQSHREAVRGKRFQLSAPRQLLYADVCSFFTGRQHKSYFVVVDGYSYLTSAYVLVSPETSDQIATHLIHYCSTHHTPSGICLDHAAVHEGILAQALALLNIRKYQCSSRVPAPNLSERVHQYLIRLLGLLYSSFQVKDEHLPCLVSFAIHVFNNTPLRSLTDKSPYDVHFGAGGNMTACVPTIHVAQGSTLPSYVKALARLQAATWAAVNDLKRAKEKEHISKGDLLRKPLFRPGDCVRMKTNTLATTKHHKLVERYKKQVYKVLKVLPSSGNYILLKLTDTNILKYGFLSKQAVPKSCLTWAKESRLKRCHLRGPSGETLAGKLFALLADVAFKQHPTPYTFSFDPQVHLPKGPGDPLLHRLSKLVFDNNQPKYRRQVIRNNLQDSQFGAVPPLSDIRAKSVSTVPAAESKPFADIVRKVLSPDLAQLYKAAGCKPFHDGPQDDDSSGNGDMDDDIHPPPRPATRARNVAASAGPPTPQAVAPARQVAAHAKAGPQRGGKPAQQQQQPLRELGARPKLSSARPGQPGPRSSSPSSSASSTRAVYEQWDASYDFPGNAGASGSKECMPPAKSSHPPTLANKRPPTRCKLVVEQGYDIDHGQDDQEGCGEEEDEEGCGEEEDERSFHSFSGSPGQDENEDDQPCVRPPPSDRSTSHIVPLHTAADSPSVIDLTKLPKAGISIYGPQTFGNQGLNKTEFFLPPPSDKSKKSRLSKSRKNVDACHEEPPPSAPPSPPPPPPPHPDRTRPPSGRVSTKPSRFA